MYLVEALRHDVGKSHEDRLTQVLAASFNSSALIARHLISFLGVKPLPGLRARTQVSNRSGASRPDLVIYSGEKPYILIENKVDAPVGVKQLRSHLRLQAKHNFVFVQTGHRDKLLRGAFRCVRWYDFFGSLEKRLGKLPSTNSLEQFLGSNLLKFAEEASLLYPDRITPSDFESAADVLTALRLRRWPNFGVSDTSPFRSLDRMRLFLERVLSNLRDDAYFRDRLKPFRTSLQLSNLFDNELEEQLAAYPTSDKWERRLKYFSITLSKSLKLKRNASGVSGVSVGFEFLPYIGSRCALDLSAKRLEKLDATKLKYRTELNYGVFDPSGITWREPYSGKVDVAFDDFYRTVTAYWRRRLK